MYQPEHFNVTDTATLHEVIRTHPLAQLVTAGPSGLMANPVPFLLDVDGGEGGLLLCHLARANPQWKEIEAGAECLVIFQGREGYVTPGWYPTKREHGKVVPTWNYVTVQARGIVRTIHDGAWLHEHVSRLSDRHEAARATPWAVTDAPESFIAALTRGIVGVEMRITALSGKFKLSQNRPAQDREGVMVGLSADGDGEMADLVQTFGRPRS